MKDNKDKKYFEVLKEIKSVREILSYTLRNETLHLAMERNERLKAYNLESNKILNAFIVDKQHPNGLEVHMVDNQGYIQIFNKESKRFITALSGRPSQIKRYYLVEPKSAITASVREAIKIAEERNKVKNFNNI